MSYRDQVLEAERTRARAAAAAERAARTLPTRIRTSRRALGYSIREAADLAGITADALSMMERGRRRITAPDLYRLHEIGIRVVERDLVP